MKRRITVLAVVLVFCLVLPAYAAKTVLLDSVTVASVSASFEVDTPVTIRVEGLTGDEVVYLEKRNIADSGWMFYVPEKWVVAFSLAQREIVLVGKGTYRLNLPEDPVAVVSAEVID